MCASDPLGLDRLLPPLLPTDDGLIAAPLPAPALHVPVGVGDDGVCWADLGGHTLVTGAGGSGRSSVLAVLMAGLALTRSARAVQFYCLAAGPGPADLAGLPHVGAVVDPGDRPAALGLLRHLAARPDQDVEIYLVVDGPAQLAGLGPELVATADAAPGREVHLLLAADDLDQVPSPLRTWFTTRIGLDRNGSGRVVGIDGRARSFVGAQARIGIAPTGSAADSRRRLAADVARNWGPREGAPAAQPARTSISNERNPRRARLGLTDTAGNPLEHDFARHRALVVRGGPGSGKTTLLRTLAAELVRERTPAQVRVLLVDRRAGLIDAVDEKFLLGHAFHAGGLQALIDGTLWALAGRRSGQDWKGPRLYVLIDDHVNEPSDEDIWAPVIGYLEAEPDTGVHLVLVESPDPPETVADEEISTIPLSRALLDTGAATVTLRGGRVAVYEI